MKKLLNILAIAWLISASVVTGATAKPTHLFIVLDLSGSQDLLNNRGVNDRIAAKAADVIANLNLEFDSIVSLRTLGEIDYAGTINLRIDEHLTFTGGLHPEAIPSEISKIIQSVFGMQGQQSTHISYAVEAVGYEMDCSTRDGVIILISDGAATGEVNQSSGRMKDLPQDMFADCGGAPLYIVGFGASSYYDNAPDRLRQTMGELNRFATYGGFSRVAFIQ